MRSYIGAQEVALRVSKKDESRRGGKKVKSRGADRKPLPLEVVASGCSDHRPFEPRSSFAVSRLSQIFHLAQSTEVEAALVLSRIRCIHVNPATSPGRSQATFLRVNGFTHARRCFSGKNVAYSNHRGTKCGSQAEISMTRRSQEGERNAEGQRTAVFLRLKERPFRGV